MRRQVAPGKWVDDGPQSPTRIAGGSYYATTIGSPYLQGPQLRDVTGLRALDSAPGLFQPGARKAQILRGANARKSSKREAA